MECALCSGCECVCFVCLCEETMLHASKDEDTLMLMKKKKNMMMIVKQSQHVQEMSDKNQVKREDAVVHC